MNHMTFIDGENLTFRAQQLAKEKGFKLQEGRSYKKDCFIWDSDVYSNGLARK